MDDFPSEKGPAPRFFAVDFFCGAGGATRGLIDAGGYVCAGVDNHENCEMTYVRNNRNVTGDLRAPFYLRRDLQPATSDHPEGELELACEEIRPILRRARERWRTVPLVFVICAPCQPFTKVSRKQMSLRRVAKRQRDSELLPASARLVEAFGPDVVICENVPGISDERYGSVFERFCASLRELGYATNADVVCASRFGVPQFRRRRILIAFSAAAMQRSDLTLMPPVPTADPGAKTMTVREAIERFPPLRAGESHATVPNHRTRSLTARNRRRLQASAPGQSNARLAENVTSSLALECHVNFADRGGAWGFGDVYTRMSPDRPSPTITTKSHSISNGRFGHYEQLRALSPREAAALQTFPDNYVFYPTHLIEPVTRMIGNAIPPALMKYMIEYAMELIAPKRASVGATNEHAAE